MKRKFPVFLALILLSGAFFLFSCKGKVSNFGTLSITVMTKDTLTSGITSLQIFIASSKQNLDSQVYVSSGWLSGSGSYIFRDLAPGYYWYRVQGWNDYGAAEVFAGVDASVILWLNSPAASKK